MIIDAHQHFWQIGQNDQSWPVPELASIYRDFLPRDLVAAATDRGIDGTVLVQSQPSTVDTAWLLDLAAQTPLVKGVIGWTDLAVTDASRHIAELAKHPKLKGLRPMLQGLAEDDWILKAEVQPALGAMIKHDLCFDALVFARHLPAIDVLAKRYPELKIVIDHGAKPPVASATSTPHQSQIWREHMAKVAQNPNVACKLSGLLTEASLEQSPNDVRAYADYLLAIFGPNRLMWGSDWPVVLLRAPYRDWFDWTANWLDGKPPSTKDAILGTNAQTLYVLS